MSAASLHFARGRISVLLIALPAVTLLCCGPSRTRDTTGASAGDSADEQQFAADDPRSWVTTYDPEKADNGYTLVLHGARRPTLIDMNGRIVHSWPGARVKSRVRLLTDGSLLGLALDRAIVEYDWAGNLTWRFEVEDGLPHHDVIRLENGNTLFPVLPNGSATDEIWEVDSDGQIRWKWSAGTHLARFIDEYEADRGDVTHINSLQEIPVNDRFRGGDERFRPGNLLISARNLNEIFVLDRTSGEVVWSYGVDLDLQHEALLIPQNYPGHGHILIFDNGYRNSYRYRRSRILEIDPAQGSLVWEFTADGFYSPTQGVEQPLVNGNVLIGSSRGGRAFEVNRKGETVWQWVPPFDPVRPSRYPFDHCPQLAALPRPDAMPVRPRPDQRHVDRWTYGFAPRGALREEMLERTTRTVLVDNNDCRELLLPLRPQLTVSYGVDRRRVASAGRTEYAARFHMRLRPQASTDWVSLFEDTIDLSGRRWQEKTLALDSFALQWIELCVDTLELGAESDTPTEAFAFWSNPSIRPADTPPAPTVEDVDSADDLTPAELEVRRRHLKALGYIN
ncbi:MAG: aryl-sulfate sulfotransferase [Acidobacteriota bacterium]|nr:aryl-sulfate sulfotransferase [Acidobacteriota bacterium]